MFYFFKKKEKKSAHVALLRTKIFFQIKVHTALKKFTLTNTSLSSLHALTFAINALRIYSSMQVSELIYQLKLSAIYINTFNYT